MSWKDWLFIPKSDKIAIIILLAVNLILLGIYLFVTLSSKQNKSLEIADYISDEHKAWENKLYSKIEEQEAKEKQQISFNFYHQPKLKAGETVELNSADTTSLKTIPGIGSSFANRIAKYRTSLGGYAQIEQLNEVWGLDTYLYSQIEPHLTIEPKHDSIYINQASFQELIKHPYLSYKQVEAIVDIRERKGNIKSFKRLELLDEFKKRDIEKLRLYVSFK